MSEPVTLAAALGLGTARVVALTGGGGKTAALFRLAREAAPRRVLVTTTTRIWAPGPDQAPLALVADLDAALARLAPAAWPAGPLALGTTVTPDGKLVGVPPEWIGALATCADCVVVEADGAAGKPLTAPRAYEPVIPPAAELIVPVVGLDALGAPLDAAAVHRAPEIAALTGLPLGAPLTPEAIAAVLLDPRGNVKGAPPGARIVPLINKVDDTPALARARVLAAALLARGAARVVLGRLASDPPVADVLVADGTPVAGVAGSQL